MTRWMEDRDHERELVQLQLRNRMFLWKKSTLAGAHDFKPVTPENSQLERPERRLFLVTVSEHLLSAIDSKVIIFKPSIAGKCQVLHESFTLDAHSRILEAGKTICFSH